MAVRSLSSSAPTSDDKFYLDTSAVFSLGAEFGMKSTPGWAASVEGKRAKVLNAFLDKASKAGAIVRTSVLAYEEIAAKARRDALGHEGVQSLSDVFARDAARAEAVVKTVHGKIRTVLDWAANALGARGISVETPPVPPNETCPRAVKLRKAHRQLLLTYGRIDSMDSLHIVTGLELGITNFVCFDNGWQQVNEIDVYC